MTIDLAIRRGSPTGERDVLRLNQATRATISTNGQGDERADVQFPAPLADQFRFRDRAGLPYLVASAWGGRVFTGRVEDPTLTNQGLQLVALGGSRALTDIPYTALWSTGSYDQWRPATTDDNSTRFGERAEFDQQDRLFIAPQKNTSYSSAFAIAQTTETPVTQTGQGGRQFVGISFDFQAIAPTNWQFILTTWNRAYSGVVASPWVLNATAALQTGTIHLVLTACDRLELYMLYNAAATVFAAETGSAYLKITNLRAVTSTTNRISTTLTANRAAGAGVTATVGSTARMYVGQQLQIDTGAALSETVTVTSITSATQFVATFVNAYVIGDTVNAHIVYADEVVKDLISFTSGINSGQLSSSTGLVQSPGRDLIEAQWLDAAGDGILNELIERGDTSNPPRRWRWYVDSGQRLGSADPSTVGRTWYVDVTSLEALQSLESLVNSAYSVYEAPDGTTTRTAVSADAQSVLRFGVTRRAAVSAQATNTAQAEAKRDTAIADGKNPPGRATITFDAVYDARGAAHPLWLVRGGDTFVIRNLPPAVLGGIVDRIRSFRLARTEYDLLTNVLTVEPEEPQIGLEASLVVGLRSTAIASMASTAKG